MAADPSSALRVPELEDLGGPLTARLGEERMAELTRAGAALDRNAAAAYARRRLEAARREPIPSPREERPGGLSQRELEVLGLVAEGRTSAEIAAQLFISARTAEHRVRNIHTKIGPPTAPRPPVGPPSTRSSSPPPPDPRRCGRP